MKIFRKIIDYFKAEIAEAKAKRVIKTKAEKEWIKKLINTPMSKAYVDNYNISLIANSGGWLGGSCNEKDIKSSVLNKHWYLFTNEERRELQNKIKKNG